MADTETKWQKIRDDFDGWNLAQVLIATAAFVGGIILLYAKTLPVLSWLIVGGADGYIMFLLFLAALERSAKIPNKVPALFIVPLVFFALVAAFAGIYSNSNNITWRDPQGNSATTPQMVKTDDALYFSLVTITTYGAGAFPATATAQFAVEAELLSGALLLLMSFPILAARLALFDVMPAEKAIYIEKSAGENWKIVRNHTREESYPGTADREKMKMIIENGEVKLAPPS